MGSSRPLVTRRHKVSNRAGRAAWVGNQIEQRNLYGEKQLILTTFEKARWKTNILEAT